MSGASLTASASCPLFPCRVAAKYLFQREAESWFPDWSIPWEDVLQWSTNANVDLLLSVLHLDHESLLCPHRLYCGHPEKDLVLNTRHLVAILGGRRCYLSIVCQACQTFRKVPDHIAYLNVLQVINLPGTGVVIYYDCVEFLPLKANRLAMTFS